MTQKALKRVATLGFLLTVGIAVGIGASCDPTAGKVHCQPSNCDGCCDEAGQCRSGNELEACGELGGTCSACPAHHKCSGGACQPSSNPAVTEDPDAGTVDSGVPCEPGTCAGCCQMGVCTPGNADSACGTGGRECTPCAGALICSGGTCTGACLGCRDASGNCLPGNQVSACGADGGVCSSCVNDQSCEFGQCLNTACSATNCAGCCDGNICVDPVMSPHCGVGGSACVTCVFPAICQFGQCAE